MDEIGTAASLVGGWQQQRQAAHQQAMHTLFSALLVGIGTKLLGDAWANRKQARQQQDEQPRFDVMERYWQIKREMGQ